MKDCRESMIISISDNIALPYDTIYDIILKAVL